MRNIISIVGVAIMAFAFTGCGGTVGPKMTNSSGDYFIISYGNNQYAFAGYDNNSRVSVPGVYGHNASIKTKSLKSQLIEVSKYTKKLGYNYFVLTNVNISNLNGFPINNYKDLSRYITLSERKSNFTTNGRARSSDSLIIGNGAGASLNLRFMPVSSKVANSGAISVWKVSDFI